MSTFRTTPTKLCSARASVSSLALALVLALVPVTVGCGPGSSGSGTGGETGSGGIGTGGAAQTGSGGQSSTGGRTGSAGQSGTGGQQGTGGQLGNGGQPETGGQLGTGGRLGSGGAQTSTDGGVDAGAGAGGQGAGDGAGGGGRGGGGGAPNPDGGIPFAPCPSNGTPCVILPLGDSITDGYPFENGGYRVELFHRTLLGSQHVTFVGSLANGPTAVDGTPFPRNHEGHSGDTIVTGARTGISGSLTDTAISRFRPHIILLMIGTNDVDISVDLVNAPTRLGALLDEIIRDAPNALLVVAQITPTTTDAENVRFQTYNAAIPGLVQERASTGKHVTLVNMYAAFTANVNYKTAYMNDNLHPSPAGYTLMGQTWYTAIRSFLPVGP